MDQPLFGYLEFKHITLQAPENSDVKLMIYTPYAATRAKLKNILNMARFLRKASARVKSDYFAGASISRCMRK